MSNPSRPLADAVIVISDLVEPQSSFPSQHQAPAPIIPPQQAAETCAVQGGYLERLPLAMVKSGWARFAEIWHHHRGSGAATFRENEVLTRRAFPVASEAPFHSDAMVDFIREYGAPRILCVWGLGVSEALIEACPDSVIIYNSIDVPALRVPAEISRHFDLVLTGSWQQSYDVLARHDEMLTAVLPIGPEFASAETFFPLPESKQYDVIYVAAAQPYKRHDILFSALARAGRRLKALCVMGYGEDGERLRRQAQALGLAVDFVGPPGVPHSEVNRLMNQARVGVVCGIEDGAPAILTEYMLAGLPVVANAELRCGLHYILPSTGIAAPAETFDQAILEALARDDFSPRQAVLDRWTWQHSLARLGSLIEPLVRAKTASKAPAETLGEQA